MGAPDRDPLEQAKAYALRLLAIRARSEYELRQRLFAKGFDPRTVTDALATLRALDLIDDEQFARAWVEYRQASRPLGRRGLRWHLRRHGVPAPVADEVAHGALDSEGELELALTLARKRLRAQSNPGPTDLARLARFLAGRGLDPEVIRQALAEVGAEGLETD